MTDEGPYFGQLSSEAVQHHREMGGSLGVGEVSEQIAETGKR